MSSLYFNNLSQPLCFNDIKPLIIPGDLAFFVSNEAVAQKVLNSWQNFSQEFVFNQLRSISKVPEGEPGSSPYTMWQLVSQLISVSD